MNQNESVEAELGVSTPASVVESLGFPNNRVEVSPEPTGWQASRIEATGKPDQSLATVEEIGK